MWRSVLSVWHDDVPHSSDVWATRSAAGSRPEVVRQGFRVESCFFSPSRFDTREQGPAERCPPLSKGRSAHTAALVVSGYRSPLIQETAYVEHDVMRPSGELPTAGQRRGRNRRPAGPPWTTRDITSKGEGRQPTDPRNSTAKPSTGTGYPGSSRFLNSGEPRFLKALR
jgi:hypothetical protein